MAHIRYNRIKIVLAEKAWLSKDLAAALQMTPTTVSDWCTNKAQPSIPTLFEIALVLDVDVRELLMPSKNK